MMKSEQDRYWTESMHHMFRIIRRVLDEYLECKTVYPIYMNYVVRKASVDLYLKLTIVLHSVLIHPTGDCHYYHNTFL